MGYAIVLEDETGKVFGQFVPTGRHLMIKPIRGAFLEATHGNLLSACWARVRHSLDIRNVRENLSPPYKLVIANTQNLIPH